MSRVGEVFAQLSHPDPAVRCQRLEGKVGIEIAYPLDGPWLDIHILVIFPDAIEKMTAYLAAKMPAVEADTRQPVSRPQATEEVAQSAEQPAEERDATAATSAPKHSKAKKSKR